MSGAKDEFEVVVIGGGPAGASAAILLRQKGHRVLVLEREKFPRFMVGESLLPAAWDMWEKLKVRTAVEAMDYPTKRGVLFKITDTTGTHEFLVRTDEYPEYFVHPFTFHVDRASFDQLLLSRAREEGATVMEGCEVEDVLFEGERAVGVAYRDPDGTRREIRAQVVVDASGRSTVIASKLRRRYPHPKLLKVAYYTHYENAGRRLAEDGSTVTDIHSTEGGWIWVIPLRDRVSSVGVVLDAKYVQEHKGGPQVLFDRAIANDPQISDWLAGAKQCFKLKHVSSISYLSDSFVGDGFVMIGDAAMFLDPIFSAGVMLAMRGADLASEAISAALAAGDVSAKRFASYEEKIRRPVEKMHKIITNWYDIMASRNRNHVFRLSQTAPLLRRQLVILLSGGYDKADMDAFLAERERVEAR